MTLTPVTLGVRSNPGRYGPDGACRLINCYAEDAGDEGKIRWPIHASDGHAAFATLIGGIGGVRAMLALDDSSLYVVAGRLIFKVTSAGVVSTLGGFETSGVAFMARNRRTTPQIGIVSGGLYYLITSDAVTQVSDGDLPAPNSICFFNGYFVLTISDGRYFITALEDGTTVDVLDFASAETNADSLLLALTRGSDLCLMGSRSIEFHVVDPNAEFFPFIRNASINIGLYAAGAACEITVVSSGMGAVDSIGWCATDSQGAYAGVMLLNGYSATKISTPAVDRAVRDEPDRDTIRMFTWSSGGHCFLAVAGDTFTWVYDTVTDQWHERESYGLPRWRANSATAFGTSVILGDYNVGRIYTMSPGTQTDGDDPLIMTVQPPAIHAWPHPLRFNAVHIDTIPGTGINSTNEADLNPKLMITHSNDGGKTWKPERHEEIGKLGKYAKRIKSTRFGDSKEDGKVFRLSVSAAVVRAFIGMAVDIDQLQG
jgi:hypothetical protein